LRPETGKKQFNCFLFLRANIMNVLRKNGVCFPRVQSDFDILQQAIHMPARVMKVALLSMVQ
jgi:hypothetical protein